MLKGQGLCGAIKYVYNAQLDHSILCFCIDCQRAQGGMMAWNSPIDRSKFDVIQGKSLLKEYRHTPMKSRVFCENCGSPIYSYRDDLPNVIRLRLGTVTTGHKPKPLQIHYIERKEEYLSLR